MRRHDGGRMRVGVNRLVFISIVMQVAFGLSEPEDPTAVAGMLRSAKPPMP